MRNWNRSSLLILKEKNVELTKDNGNFKRQDIIDEASKELADTQKEKFNKLCEENGISGLKGHRSVGGYRASIYNALPFESIEVLIDVMKKFEKISLWKY